MKRVNMFNNNSNPNSYYKFPISSLKLISKCDPEIEHVYEGPHIYVRGKGRNKDRPYYQSYCQISNKIMCTKTKIKNPSPF